MERSQSSDRVLEMTTMILNIFEVLSTFEASRPAMQHVTLSHSLSKKLEILQGDVLGRIEKGVREGWIPERSHRSQLKTIRWELTRH